jgi:hypothetical protein
MSSSELASPVRHVRRYSKFHNRLMWCTDSNFARHAFDTFIPISVDSGARQRIIFDFFDLLSAVAARGKSNGMGGRKLSRLAGWWAFEFSEDGKGFDGGYRTWEK